MVLDENGSRVILFGGRDNDIVREHVPKTYEVRVKLHSNLEEAPISRAHQRPLRRAY